MTKRNERGSVILTATIVIVVVTIIGVAIIRFASREVAGAWSGANRQALSACAESARQLLVSRFHAVGLSPSSIQALGVAPDTNYTLDGTGGRAVAMGGHIGEDPTNAVNVQVNQVVFLPENAFGPSTRSRDLTNTVALMGQGGRPIRVVVHCVDHGDGTPTGGRQMEIEFGVRFGL
jgi:hypothetical protein